MKHRNPVAILLLGLLVAAAAGLSAQQSQQPPQQPQQPRMQTLDDPAAAAERQQALQAIRQASKPEEVTALIEQYLQKYPDAPDTWELTLLASDAFRQLRKYDKAIEYGEKAVALKPAEPAARILLADLLAASARGVPNPAEKLVQAQKRAQEALELLPVFLDTWSAPAEMAPEEFETRKKLYEAHIRSTLGYIYLLRDQNALAEGELVKATELSQAQPNQGDYLLLGRAYFLQGKYQQAVATFQKAVSMGGPQYDTALRYLQAAEEALAKSPPAAPQKPESKPPEAKPPQPPAQP